MIRSLTLFTLLCLANISAYADDGFTIKGTISGGYTGYIYLSSANSRDSSYIKTNTFEFTGKVGKSTLAWLHLEGYSNAAWVYLENSMITVRGDFSTTVQDNVPINLYLINSITGSYSQKLLNDYRAFCDQYRNEKNFNELRFTELKKVFASNSRQPVCAYILSGLTSSSVSHTYEEFLELFTLLDVTSMNPSDVDAIKGGLRALNLYGIGQSFANFELPDQYGRKVSSIDYKGKIILIDFWASWCAPCRAKHPELVALQKKYQNNNFRVVSISIDTDKLAWKNAIIKDGLVWDNLLDIDRKVLNELSIQAIPFNYLLDENGEIIGLNQSLEKIHLLLEEKFK